MNRRIIVTGTARSGTLYTARLLAKIGLQATHERVYSYAMDPDGSDHNAINEAWRGKQVDVNWMAAPFLKHEPVTTVVWHQTRDPLKIVQCFWSHWMLDDPRAFAFELVRKVMPKIDEMSDDLAKAIHHVHRWQDMVEQQRGRLATLRYKVEDLDARKLRWLLAASGIDEFELKGESIEEAFAGMPKNVNACHGHKELSWREIEGKPGGVDLAFMARRYGYQTC